MQTMIQYMYVNADDHTGMFSHVVIPVPRRGSSSVKKYGSNNYFHYHYYQGRL